jgi:glutamate dehydrogenase
MMENMGLRVISEHPYRIESNGDVAYIQDFEVEATQGDIDIDRLDENFEDAFARIWRGEAENDGFNRSCDAGRPVWRQVAMLRGYCKYLLQTGVPFSQSYVEATFSRYPLLVRLLVELFEARFDPCTGSESKAAIKQGMERFGAQLQALLVNDPAAFAAVQPVIDARAGTREQQIEATRSTFLGMMDRVSSLDDDRILRSFIGVIDATLRTSYYIEYKDGKRKDGGPPTTSPSSSTRQGAGPAQAAPVSRNLRVRPARGRRAPALRSRSRAVVCAGPIAAKTSARKCSAW